MIFGLGPSELLVILIIVVLIYGGKRIPEIGHSLGKSISEFKKAKNGYKKQSVVDKWVNSSAEPGKKNRLPGTDSGKDEDLNKAASEAVKEKINKIK